MTPRALWITTGCLALAACAAPPHLPHDDEAVLHERVQMEGQALVRSAHQGSHTSSASIARHVAHSSDLIVVGPPPNAVFLCDPVVQRSSSGRHALMTRVDECAYYGPNVACPIPPDLDVHHTLNLANFCGVIGPLLIRWPAWKQLTPTVEFQVCVGGAEAAGCQASTAQSYFASAAPTITVDGSPRALELLDATPHACSHDATKQCVTAAAPGLTPTSNGPTSIRVQL